MAFCHYAFCFCCGAIHNINRDRDPSSFDGLRRYSAFDLLGWQGMASMNPHKTALMHVALLCIYILAALVLDYAIFGPQHY
jgi:hypothetical protein